jgi:hypothetical protein
MTSTRTCDDDGDNACSIHKRQELKDELSDLLKTATEAQEKLLQILKQMVTEAQKSEDLSFMETSMDVLMEHIANTQQDFENADSAKCDFIKND